MSDPLQYVPVGELDTENTVLVGKGYNRESIYIHALALNFLSTTLKSKSDKDILHRCTSPREAWDAFFVWYGPQITGGKSDLSRRLNSCKIAQGSNPLQEMGRIEDVAAEMRTAGMTHDDHMLYTTLMTLFLPKTKWRQGTLHLVIVSTAMTSSRLCENGTTDFLETLRRGPILAMPAMLCSPAAAMVVTENGPAAVPTVKVEAAVKEKVDVGDGKDAAEKAPTRTVVARPRLPGVMATAPKPPMVVLPR